MSRTDRPCDNLFAITPAARQAKPADALLTRKELSEYITNELGRPLSFSTLSKVCALGEGPPVYEWWGRFPLYRREDGRAWADARARKMKPGTKAEASPVAESPQPKAPPRSHRLLQPDARSPTADPPPSPPQPRRRMQRRQPSVVEVPP
jgi:hypothetical protein